MTTAADDAYDRLTDHLERLTNVSTAAGVLRWDQEVMMPSGGTPARAKQLSTLSSLSHELLTDDVVADCLDALEDATLEADRRAVVREVRRKHDRAVAVPRSLVEELSEATANAHPVWREARETDDFDRFAPTLERLVELRREYAAAIDPDRPPYAVLFEDHEPHLSLETAERVLDRLRDGLVPLLASIRGSEVDLTTDAFAGTFDDGDQEALARDLLDALGYDWDRGRLDTAPHPFSTGTQFDARVTTRFDESDLLGSVTSTIHEFGHASYTLGLPREDYGTPLGEARDLTVHESQSRLWENHVGRSQPFWEHVLPLVADRFPSLASVSPREAYESANRVRPENLVRVEADELTYHLHIVVRFEIERALFEDEITVAEVPSVWNDAYESTLGVRPESDADGCLQDIHWSHGSFGYFPTYSLGSVLAAQLYEAASSDIDDLEGSIAAGEFDALREWQREHVHRHGCRYRTDALIERATGDPLSAAPFLAYARSKYGDLYGL